MLCVCVCWSGKERERGIACFVRKVCVGITSTSMDHNMTTKMTILICTQSCMYIHYNSDPLFLSLSLSLSVSLHIYIYIHIYLSSHVFLEYCVLSFLYDLALFVVVVVVVVVVWCSFDIHGFTLDNLHNMISALLFKNIYIM